jgi:ABC-type dipeptide/oligopeptide/nickel transport system permease component
VFVGINAAVDIAYALIDPRVGNSTARARSA